MSIRILSTVILSVLLLGSCSDNSTGSSKNNGIQVNGIYEAPGENNGISSYARFYPDSDNTLSGTAMCVASYTGSIDKIKEWFLLENKEKYAYGEYTITEDSIFFSIGSTDSTVEYKGEILKDSLILFYHSNLNGNEGTEHYFFHTLD